jgi:uncharacterized membrane protein YgdD (TMEM256/DUF423 family)
VSDFYLSGRLFIFIGALSGTFSVALGAFGAHALKEILTGYQLSVYQTACDYQMIHSLALVLVGIMTAKDANSLKLRWAGWTLVTGMTIFSGSLYLLVATDQGFWGAVTPLGGVLFIIGWFLMALSVVKPKTRSL